MFHLDWWEPNESTCASFASSVESERRVPGIRQKMWLKESGESTTEFAGVAREAFSPWDVSLDSGWHVVNSLAVLHTDLAPADSLALGLNFF